MANITLQLPPELEQKLRAEAAKQGINPDRYILNALQERLQVSRHSKLPLSKAEADLLEQINIGLPAQRWQEYHSLLAKRRAETLTEAEQSTLIAISDRIEQANVQRVRALIALAEMRGTDLSTLMRQLGIVSEIDG
jgi:predicted DNA binding CopG/RHH family protein